MRALNIGKVREDPYCISFSSAQRSGAFFCAKSFTFNARNCPQGSLRLLDETGFDLDVPTTSAEEEEEKSSDSIDIQTPFYDGDLQVGVSRNWRHAKAREVRQRMKTYAKLL